MLAAPKRKVKVWAYPILALALVGIGYYIWKHPKSLYIISAISILIWVQTFWERRSRRRLALTRSGESICTFVDSFDCRHTDTWILRAIYEELSRYLAVEGHPIPVRADDQCFEGDLEIDREDLDDLVVDAAARSGRSMDGATRNPYYGKVRTVRDLVGFLEHQPRLETSNNSPEPSAVGSSGFATRPTPQIGGGSGHGR
jgi:hypothetical protein